MHHSKIVCLSYLLTSIPEDPGSEMSLMLQASCGLSGEDTSPRRTLVGKHSRRMATTHKKKVVKGFSKKNARGKSA